MARTQTHTEAHKATGQAGEIDKRKNKKSGFVLSRQIHSRKHWDACEFKVQCGNFYNNLVILKDAKYLYASL